MGQVHWYLYLSIISTTMKVLVLNLNPFFISAHYLYMYSSTKGGIYKYSNTCKYFEVPVSSF